MSIYCSILLDRDSNDTAEKVLEILDAAQPTPGLPYESYRAQALKQLGRLEESARFLVHAVDFNESPAAPLTVLLLSEILDKIELWQQNARDFNEMLENCFRLAKYASESIKGIQTTLILTEISILQGKTAGIDFPSADVNWLRPNARLLMHQGDFEQSARLWAKIAEIRRNDTNELNKKSYGWWQAKFYELDCLAKIPDADKQNIAHTIDVLFNTYPQIPAPWPEKLDLLKNRCTAN
jgi:tetratricopeptide (TPR) repeat protein